MRGEGRRLEGGEEVVRVSPEPIPPGTFLMPRGTQLGTLRAMLQAELGDDTTGGQAAADVSRLNQLLYNKQVELASAYDWPFLRDRQDVVTVGGQRFYLLPLLNYDRPHSVKNDWNLIWTDMDYGITEDDYNMFNSLIGQTSDPTMKWLIVGQADVPAPSTAPVANLAAGVLTGAYSWVYTFVTEYGETPASPAASLTLASQGALINGFGPAPVVVVQGTNVTVPCTTVNIYRTKAGGSAFFFAAQRPIGGAFGDSLSDSFLTIPLAPSSLPTSTFELWPIPQTPQTIRFRGERSLNPLALDTDQADLDDILLIKGVAAQELARRESADASMVAQQFSQRLALLRLAGPSAPSVWVNGEMSETRTRSTRRVLLG